MLPRSTPPLSGRRLRSIIFVAGVALLALVAAMSGSTWALYSAGGTNSGNELVAAADWVAPTASASVIGKTQGGVPGYIHQGGGYNVYAQVADGGATPSGIASVAGNMGTITTGQTAASLSAGAFSIGGTSYNYRSAGLTANATLGAGTLSYSLTSKDTLNNSRLQTGYTVIVDNTAPTAVDIQATNKSGNTAGKPEIGDSVVFTYGEPIDPVSVLAGWSGAATNVVVRIDNNAISSNDRLAVYDASNTTQLSIGTVNLSRNDYVTANVTYGASGTASTMVMSGNTITVTLGTASAGASTASSTSAMIWSPSASAFDWAGNAESTSTRTETGVADKEF